MGETNETEILSGPADSTSPNTISATIPSEMLSTGLPVQGNLDDEEILELGDDYDYGGFEVVRREFFANLQDPAVSFNNYKFSVSAACLKKMPDVEYVQVLINQKTKILALRPCSQYAQDAYPWALESKGKRKPRAVTCRLFFAKVLDMMGWDPNCRYRILGRLAHANGEYLLAFDLKSKATFPRITKDSETKTATSRTALYPSEWQNQFGLPLEEHEKSMQINFFDGYAVYSIKLKKDQNDAGSAVEMTAAQLLPVAPTDGGEIDG